MVTPGRKIFILSNGKVKESEVNTVCTTRTPSSCTVCLQLAESSERFDATVNSADSTYIAAHMESAVFRGTSAVACFSRAKLEALRYFTR